MNYSLTEKELDAVVTSIRRERDAANKANRTGAVLAFDHALDVIQNARHQAFQKRSAKRIAKAHTAAGITA